MKTEILHSRSEALVICFQNLPYQACPCWQDLQQVCVRWRIMTA